MTTPTVLATEYAQLLELARTAAADQPGRALMIEAHHSRVIAHHARKWDGRIFAAETRAETARMTDPARTQAAIRHAINVHSARSRLMYALGEIDQPQAGVNSAIA